MGTGQRGGGGGRGHLRLQWRARVLDWQQHSLASLLLLLRQVGRRNGTGRRRPCCLLLLLLPSLHGRLVASLRSSRRRVVLLLNCPLLPSPVFTPFLASSNSPRRVAPLRESCLPPSLVVPIPSSASRVPQKVRAGERQRCRGQRVTKSCGLSRVARVQGRVLVCRAVCRWH